MGRGGGESFRLLTVSMAYRLVSDGLLVGCTKGGGGFAIYKLTIRMARVLFKRIVFFDGVRRACVSEMVAHRRRRRESVHRAYI